MRNDSDAKADNYIVAETNHTEPEATDVELEDIESAEEGKIKKLREKLAACEAQKKQQLEDLQRTKADFLNSKRRLEEDRSQDRERSINSHVKKLLPLCDSFQMAMSNKASWEQVDATWRSGVEGIYNQLKSILTAYQVMSIEPAIGETFDPTRHEAVSSQDKGQESDTVIEILQSGYERKGTVIRPAKVIINN